MSQFNAPTFDIERPTGQCAFSGRDLEPGEDYIAVLVELSEHEADDANEAGDAEAHLPASKKGDKDDAAEPKTVIDGIGLKRVDVSLEMWDAGHRPEHVFSYWRTTVPIPNEKKKLFVDDEVLLNLLRRMADTTDPQRQAFRFVLCLILMRKKLVRYDRTERRDVEADGDSGDEAVTEDWWIITPKLDVSKGPLGKWHPDESLEVLDPHLDEAQVLQVTEQLGEILQAEL